MDEYLDLVDEEDEVIGKMLRSKVYAEGRNNFRVVNSFVVNSEGRIWIPRRAASKRIFPSCLDMSMGGHVESGESYDEAFRRETREELNIDTDSVVWKMIGHLSPQDGVSAFMNVYEVKMDEAPNYNPNDYTEYFWLTPGEVLEKIQNGEKSKSDLPILVRRFYS